MHSSKKTMRNDTNICMLCVFSTVNISGVGRDNVIHFFETSQIISSLTLSHLGPRVATHIARWSLVAALANTWSSCQQHTLVAHTRQVWGLDAYSCCGKCWLDHDVAAADDVDDDAADYDDYHNQNASDHDGCDGDVDADDDKHTPPKKTKITWQWKIHHERRYIYYIETWECSKKKWVKTPKMDGLIIMEKPIQNGWFGVRKGLFRLGSPILLKVDGGHQHFTLHCLLAGKFLRRPGPRGGPLKRRLCGTRKTSWLEDEKILRGKIWENGLSSGVKC